MMMRALSTFAIAIACFGGASGAQAKGIGAEANYGKSERDWGAELGVGYKLGLGLPGLSGFSLTPGAGVFIHDGKTDIYGRVEAAYTLPASATIGVGVRIADKARPYATLAMPIMPLLGVKANVGPDYYALGLKLAY